jgi:hypothetical protein
MISLQPLVARARSIAAFPLSVLIWCATLAYEAVRFPLLWINVMVRTVIFGAVTFFPVIHVRKQFLDMCAEGRAIDGQLFSTRHSGALLGIEALQQGSVGGGCGRRP